MDHWVFLGCVASHTSAVVVLLMPYLGMQTCRSIASEEGFWGFYKGFVCNVLFLLNSYYTNVQEEAATGKVCV